MGRFSQGCFTNLLALALTICAIDLTEAQTPLRELLPVKGADITLKPGKWLACSKPARKHVLDRLIPLGQAPDGDFLLDDRDSFPAMALGPLAKCQGRNRTFRIATYADVPLLIPAIAAEFQVSTDWLYSLATRPQGYVILTSRRGRGQRIAIVGGTDEGLQYGILDFLKESTWNASTGSLTWPRQNVLNYPEVGERIYSNETRSGLFEWWTMPPGGVVEYLKTCTPGSTCDEEREVVDNPVWHRFNSFAQYNGEIPGALFHGGTGNAIPRFADYVTWMDERFLDPIATVSAGANGTSRFTELGEWLSTNDVPDMERADGLGVFGRQMVFDNNFLRPDPIHGFAFDSGTGVITPVNLLTATGYHPSDPAQGFVPDTTPGPAEWIEQVWNSGAAGLPTAPPGGPQDGICVNNTSGAWPELVLDLNAFGLNAGSWYALGFFAWGDGQEYRVQVDWNTAAGAKTTGGYHRVAPASGSWSDYKSIVFKAWTGAGTGPGEAELAFTTRSSAPTSCIAGLTLTEIDGSLRAVKGASDPTLANMLSLASQSPLDYTVTQAVAPKWEPYYAWDPAASGATATSGPGDRRVDQRNRPLRTGVRRLGLGHTRRHAASHEWRTGEREDRRRPKLGHLSGRVLGARFGQLRQPSRGAGDRDPRRLRFLGECRGRSAYRHPLHPVLRAVQGPQRVARQQHRARVVRRWTTGHDHDL